MSKSAREIELKLELDPTAQEAIRRGGAIEGFAAGRPVTKTLQSIYFDTPDQALRKAKISLRVRKVGRNWVQTVKLGTGVMGGLSSPVEAEHPVAGRALDFAVIADPSVRAKLTEAIGEAPLAECFETVMKRTTRQLTRARDAARIELAFDSGNILAGAGSQPLAELEMELKSGPSLALYDAARTLLGDVPFRFSLFSKAERGYRFAEGRAPEDRAPSFAGMVRFAAGASTEVALRDVLRSCLTQISENRLVVLACEDPEGPHQLRVGLRRLRSAFRLFRPVLNPATVRPLDAMARIIATEAGALRDMDVLIDEIVAPLAGKAPDSLSFDTLLADLNASRGQHARGPLIAHLKSAEVNGFLLDLAAFTEGRGWLDPDHLGQSALLAQPVGDYADQALAGQWKKVLKFGRRIEDLSVPERHEMRKALKKMRYGVEFFGGLYPADTVKPFLKRMKKLQNIFGYLNDVAMAETLPDKHSDSGAGSDSGSGAEFGADRARLAIGFVIGWHEARCQAMWPHAKGYWDATRKTPKFWK